MQVRGVGSPEQGVVVTEGGTGTEVVLILAPGAGSSMDSPRLVQWTEAFCAVGLAVVRFDFDYRRAGRSIPDRMPQLMERYRSVAALVREELRPKVLLLGGHSMGGRVATMLAADGEPCDGLVLLSYPLHPPGRFEELRDAHLPKIICPALAFSGTRDEFCRRDLMVNALARAPSIEVHWIEDGDHSLHVRRASGTNDGAVRAEVAARVRERFVGGMN